MMRTLRDKKTMQIVLWLLVLAFVSSLFLYWGMKFQKNDNKDPNVVASVGDNTISYSDLNKIYQPALDRLYSSQNQNPTSDEMNKLKTKVLDTLIDNALLEKTAKDLKIGVSDEELAASIQHQPYFADEKGKFDKNRYYQILLANQMTPEEFEASQRQDMLIQKIHSVLADSLLYTKDELNDYSSLVNRDMKANYLSISPTAYEKTVSISEDDLKDYYEKNKSQYDKPERLKVRHILLTSQTAANPLDQQKDEKTMEDYRNQILSGKSTFSDLAKKYSQDPGSKDKGGELGWVTRGEMVKEFEDAIFALKKGEITKPFKTKFGYHIAQLEDKEQEYKSTFEDVRKKVTEEYKTEKAKQKVIALAEQLEERLQQKEDLGTAAKRLGLTLSTTAWFNGQKDIPELKNSKYIAGQLDSLYPQDWRGPLSLNEKQYFFQITAVKEGKTSADDTTGEMRQKFLSSRQSTWLKDFLAVERKKLDVKTFLNS